MTDAEKKAAAEKAAAEAKAKDSATTAAAKPLGSDAADSSQPLKAAGNSAEAAVAGAQSTDSAAQERPATPAGPKASDIPASSVVGDAQILAADGRGPGPEVLSAQEYTLSQPQLVQMFGAYFGFDPNGGVTEISSHPNGVSEGLIVKFSR